jgi:hypothetical protein
MCKKFNNVSFKTKAKLAGELYETYFNKSELYITVIR